jgi:hypothetical protein
MLLYSVRSSSGQELLEAAEDALAAVEQVLTGS